MIPEGHTETEQRDAQSQVDLLGRKFGDTGKSDGVRHETELGRQSELYFALYSRTGLLEVRQVQVVYSEVSFMGSWQG